MPAPQSLRSAAYPQETGQALVFLVVIDHPDLEVPIRLTDAGRDLVVDGEIYVSSPIEIKPPGQSDEAPEGRIRVPNVDQRIGEGVELIYGPADVTITAVLESDPSVALSEPHRLLKLQNVAVDALVVEGELRRPDLTTARWPKQWIRPAKYRAAFRQ